jgi:hypothetical protein
MRSRRVPDLKNRKSCCSVIINVNEHWTVPMALSPTVQVIDLPVLQDQTHSEVHEEPPDSHPIAVLPIRP